MQVCCLLPTCNSHSIRLLNISSDGDKACVDGAIALCRNGEWDTTSGRCATLQTCFAVPDIRNAGAVNQI